MFSSATRSFRSAFPAFFANPPNVHRPQSSNNRFVQLFQVSISQQSASSKPNPIPFGEHKQPNTSFQVQDGQEGIEHAKIQMLRNLKENKTKIYSAPDIHVHHNSNANTQNKHTSFQDYYKEVRKATEKLAQELNIQLSSIFLKDPAHKLPDLEMLAPVSQDFEKLRLHYSQIKKEIAAMIGSVGEPFGELKNLASNDLQLYSDSISVYRSFFKLVTHLANEVKGRACFGPDDDLQIIKGEESFVRKIKADTVSRVKEMIKIRDDLPSPDLYGAFIDQASIETVKNLSDVIRGTIIVDSIEQMQALIKYINYMAQSSVYIRGVQFKNIFGEADSRPDGYASVHVKIVLVYEDDLGNTRSMMTEIQLQFSSFFNGTHLCSKELMHLIMDYHRKIISGKLHIKEYDKASADGASMLQALLAMKTLKRSIPALPSAANEMVISRNPLNHLLNFLGPRDCAILSQTCHFLRYAQAAAKVLPAIVRANCIQSPFFSAENAQPLAHLYPINKHTELLPTVSSPANVDKKAAFGQLPRFGAMIGWPLGYVVGVKVADLAGQLASHRSGLGAGTPECRAACKTAWYVTLLFSIYLGGEYGFYLGKKVRQPINACLSKLAIIKAVIYRVINPNSTNTPVSQDVTAKRNIVVTSMTRLGQTIGAVAVGAVGFNVGKDAARVMLNRYFDLIGHEVIEHLRKPNEFNAIVITVTLVFWSTAVACALFSGYIGRRLGGRIGEALGARLNRIKLVRRTLARAYSVL